MDRTAEWIIAFVGVFYAAAFTYIFFFMPGGEPRGTSGQIIAVLMPMICLAISVACFENPLRKLASRFIAGCVFAVTVFYLLSEVGKPLPDLLNYQRSDTNILNAILAFAAFGVPAGRYLLTGRFSGFRSVKDELFDGKSRERKNR
ncbi:hypothetical protein EON80_25575 [bacterium]|nr:MAG: hypothetical protein EON80_25575 [bacterium]